MKSKWLLLTLTVSLLAFAAPLFGQTTVDVTFRLNTSTAVGVTDTASTVTVRGGLAPLTWDASSIQLTNKGGDYWEATVTFDTTGGATALEYKFHHDPGDNWESVPNRMLTLTGDVTLDLTYFDGDATPPYTPTAGIDVWVRVDMESAVETDGFVAGTDQVFVRGGTAPLDWGADNVELLAETGDTLIYSGVINFDAALADSAIEYKFVFGATPTWESSANRLLTLQADTTVQWVYWNNTPATGGAPETFNITFRLNTSTAYGVTDSASILTVRGGTAPLTWDAGSIQLTSIGGDYWEAIVAFDVISGADVEYKFHHDPADKWEDGGNHTINITADSTLDLWYFNTGGTTPPYTPTADIDVFVRVQMGSAVEALGFDPNSQGVYVRGAPAPLDWGANNIQLWPEVGDTLTYSGIISFNDTAIAASAEHKFVFGDTPDWEGSPNRLFTVPPADTTIQWVFWNDTPPTGAEVLDGTLNFTIDMLPWVSIGAFNPNFDTLLVVGAFQGWDRTDDAVIAAEFPPGSFSYFLNFPWSSVAANDNEFKLFIRYDSTAHSDWLDLGFRETFDDAPSWWGWELPALEGGGNRLYDWAGGDTPLDAGGYQTIIRDGVINAGNTIDVTFSVDMTDAENDPDAPFDPATDTLYVILQDPIWAALQGIEVGSINDVLKMSDSDADGVWEVTFTVNGPAYYGITYSNQYRTAAGQIVNEGGGFGFGRYRTRYIAGFDDGSWPTAFELGIDHFNVVGPPRRAV